MFNKRTVNGLRFLYCVWRFNYSGTWWRVHDVFIPETDARNQLWDFGSCLTGDAASYRRRFEFSSLLLLQPQNFIVLVDGRRHLCVHCQRRAMWKVVWQVVDNDPSLDIRLISYSQREAGILLTKRVFRAFHSSNFLSFTIRLGVTYSVAQSPSVSNRRCHSFENRKVVTWHCRDRVSSCNIYAAQQDKHSDFNE